MLVKQRYTPSLLLGLVFLLVGVYAQAAEFRVVGAPKIIAYDAPSLEGKKILIFSQGYPLEIIVNLGDWIKVRDVTGALSWVETKQTANKKIAMVNVATAIVRKADNESAPLMATLEKDVLVEVIANQKNGWIKIKHVSGVTGFVQDNQLWGGF